MSKLTQTIGHRLRGYRLDRGYSQEALAELAGLHPTYIGQVERGEKNVTVDSLAKIAGALGVSLSQVLEVVEEPVEGRSYPRMAYDLLAACSQERQEGLYRLLEQVQTLPPR
ncbi:MAG: helix-turn-helix domain-containing protein [Lawsonibacter sp.]|jgi:transcriptional regulator with XRE-family HTH domain